MVNKKIKKKPSARGNLDKKKERGGKASEMVTHLLRVLDGPTCCLSLGQEGCSCQSLCRCPSPEI